jgi:hypothetical protein
MHRSVMPASTELTAHSISSLAGIVIGVIAGFQTTVRADTIAVIVIVICVTTLTLLKVLQTD